MTPSLPSRPSPAMGMPPLTVSGSQVLVHEPVQTTLPFASWSAAYRAAPCESTSTRPTPSTIREDTVAPEVDVEPPALESLPPPQALRARRTAAASRRSDAYVVLVFMPLTTGGGRRRDC